MNVGGNPSSGFTIVETLIVLAVTGALFVAATTLINGRQSKTEFSTGVQSTVQAMQQIINESASGVFPDGSSFTCTKGSPPTLTNTANPQGTNYGCVFMGKVVQFDPGGASDKYNVFSLAGNQRNALGREVSTLAEAEPIAVERGVTRNSSFSNGITDTSVMKGGTRVAWMRYRHNSGGALVNISGVGFLSSLSSYTNGRIASGSQQLNLYAIRNSGNIPGTPLSTGTMVDTVDNYLNLDPAYEVDVCLLGVTNQSGLLIIGGGTGQLAVNVSIKGSTDCS